MIVECHSCGATYNISDEKIRGRRVRVRCKSCSEGIIVDGTRLGSDEATRVYSPSFEPAVYAGGVHDEATRVMAPSAPDLRAAAAADEWTVSVGDSDQRTMVLAALVSAYTGGLIPDEALVWREGMEDWMPVRDAPEVKAAIESNEATHVVSPAIAVRAPRRASGDRAAAVHADPAPPVVTRARQPSLVEAKPPPAVQLAPAVPPRAPSARSFAEQPVAAARVREGRARGADLFGNIEREGAEDALLESTSLSQYDDKPIGARNESSVLFSLDALKAGARRGSSAPPRGPSSPPPRTAADILGMTTGGALPGMGSLGSLLSAPTEDAPLMAPIAPEPPPRSRMDTLPPTMRARKSMVLPIAVVLGAIVIATVAFFVLRDRLSKPTQLARATQETAPERPHSDSTTVVAKSTETAASSTEPPPAATAAPTAEARASVATASPAIPSRPKAAAEPPSAVHFESSKKPAERTGNIDALKAAMRTDDESDPADKAATEPAKTKKVVLAEDTSGGDTADDTPEPPKPPFDTGAAKAALEAASTSAASCKKDDGPTGKGKVQVTFSPTGRVTSTNVVEGPFGGTTVGGCVAKLFRAAKVPAFSGDAVTVAKSFTIPE